MCKPPPPDQRSRRARHLCLWRMMSRSLSVCDTSHCAHAFLQILFFWSSDLPSQNLGAAEAVAIAQALQTNTHLLKLRCVFLSSLRPVTSMIIPYGFTAAASLQSPNAYLLLFPLHSLCHNSVGAAGAAAIGEILKHNKTLLEIE